MTRRFLPLVTLLALSTTAAADPCGMVPPVFTGNGPAPELERIGAQRTYVMFHDGMETMALRPGFSGSVDEFGMLIPFPTPPAIRKIDDDTFAHIEGAIEPPQVVVQIMDQRMVMEMAPMASAGAAMKSVEDGDSLRFDEVRVLNQEAVGMYEVAVLEAGSARALNKWMEQHGYRYPDGMDAVTNEYVALRWCFVAVKARVGDAEGVAPRPGMRQADPALPSGASFDGHVQGMAFRFETSQAVVPMRLSVFNGEDPRNVVYMLTDEPVRMNDVPQDLVVRQLPGEVVHGNLTRPLEVVYVNGSERDVGPSYKEQIERSRDPAPYNRVAKELFAGDLLATRTGQLSLDYEEQEKELLRISESLKLRGPQIDALHGTAIEEARGVAVDGALDDLKELHLTVLDGVFPQEVLASTNLSFSAWRMPKARNVERKDELTPADITTWVYR